MTKDLLRQIVNVVATIITVIFNVFSTTIFGRSVGEISDQHPVLITPAGYAFAIWGIIYAGLIAFAIYQALPAQRTNPRLRRIGYYYVVSCIGNVAWEYVWLHEQINLSLIMMFVIFVSLLLIYLRVDINRENVSTAESWCVNAPFGLYLGWITVASIVNVSVVLVQIGWNGFGMSPVTWTILLLCVALAIGLFVGWRCRDIVYLAVFAWSFIAILIKNAGSTAITMVAIVLTVITCVAMIVIAWRRRGLLRISIPAAS